MKKPVFVKEHRRGLSKSKYSKIDWQSVWAIFVLIGLIAIFLMYSRTGLIVTVLLLTPIGIAIYRTTSKK